MTRIATLAQNQAVIAQMMRGQTQVADSQRQVATGNKADRFEGIARDAAALVGANAIASRTGQFIELGNQVAGTVNVQETSLTTMYDTVKGLRDNVLKALANNSGITINVDLQNAFDLGKSVLNTRVAGRFLFAGSRADVTPFSAASLADLAIVATPATDFFENSQERPQVRLDQNLIIEYGILGDELGLKMMQSIKRIAEYNNATPIGQALTAADRTALQSEIAQLDAVLTDVIKLQASNGNTANRIENVTIRNEAYQNVNKQLIADISEVDMAQAISKLNQDKLAVEASYNVIRQISQLSLLNFLN